MNLLNKRGRKDFKDYIKVALLAAIVWMILSFLSLLISMYFNLPVELALTGLFYSFLFFGVFVVVWFVSMIAG
jgi:hypothetical protein